MTLSSVPTAKSLILFSEFLSLDFISAMSPSNDVVLRIFSFNTSISAIISAGFLVRDSMELKSSKATLDNVSVSANKACAAQDSDVTEAPVDGGIIAEPANALMPPKKPLRLIWGFATFASSSVVAASALPIF